MTARNASILFWMIAVGHAVLWILLPTWIHHGYKPDVIELQFISREWVMASAKHPMLPAWLLGVANIMTGDHFAAPFIVAQCCILVTVWAVWSLARCMLTQILALIPPLAILLAWHFNVDSANFNQNYPYTMFWTLAILFVYRSFETGKLRYWIASGIALGFGFHSKYSIFLLAATILLFAVCDSRAREKWKTSGPYLTIFVAFLIFLPHLLWVGKHGFAGTHTAFCVLDKTLLNRCAVVLRFTASQIGFQLLPLLALSTCVKWPLRINQTRSETEKWDTRFLGSMILIPFLLHCLIGFWGAVRLNPDYGIPLWPSLGIVLLLVFRSDDTNRLPRRFFIVFFVVEFVFVALFFFQYYIAPHLNEKPRRMHFPMQKLAEECDRIWSNRIDRPCPYLAGEWWLAGNAAQAMRPHPSVHAYGSFDNMTLSIPLTTWSTDKDFNRHGGLILWTVQDEMETTMSLIRERFPSAVFVENLTLSYEVSADIVPLQIGVAIVFPPERHVQNDPDSTP